MKIIIITIILVLVTALAWGMDDRTSNSYWEPEGVGSGEWTGSAWQSNQGVGVQQYVALRVIGSWYTGYRPNKIKVTFSNATVIEYFLLGVSADYWYIASNATSPDVGELIIGTTIDYMAFFARDPSTQQFSITKIEFSPPSNHGVSCYGVNTQ